MTIVDFFNFYGELAVLIGTFLLGENVIIPAFALASQNYLNPMLAIPAAFFGSFLADLFWYFVCHVYILKKVDVDKWYAKSKIGNKKIVKFVLNDHTLMSLFFIKFLAGFRLVLTLSFILVKKMSFFRFVIYSFISNSAFIAVLYFLGYLIGKGTGSVPLYNRTSTIISVVVVSVLLANIVPWIVRWVIIRKA